MINRKSLYLGVFLIAAGALMLAGQAGLIDATSVGEAARLWPLLVIAAGVGLLLRRTRLSLAGGMLAAAVPGLFLGGIVVAGPDLPAACRVGAPTSYTTRSGTFAESASADLRIACGDLDVTMKPGSDWIVRAGTSDGTIPAFGVGGSRLSVVSDAPRPFANRFFRGSRGSIGDRSGTHADAIDVSLPSGPTIDLSARIEAGAGRLDLRGGRFSRVDVALDAGRVRLDLGGSTLDRLAVTSNAGDATLLLPAADFSGDLDVNAGRLVVCVPPDLGVRIRSTAVMAGVSFGDLVHVARAWETPDYATRPHHADVTLSVNVGSVDIDPEGGCK